MAANWQQALEPVKRTNHGRVSWVVDLRAVGEGRRFFRSEAAALDFCERRASELRAFGREALTFDDTRRMAFYRAEQKLAALGATIDDAVDHYLANHGGIASKPLAAAIAEYSHAKQRANCRQRYLDLLRSTLGHFLRFTAIQHVHEATRDTVEAWLNHTTDTKGKVVRWSATTRKHYLQTVSSFFEWCRHRRWLKVNPCTGIDAPLLDDKPPGILTLDECTCLLQRLLLPEHKPLIAFVTVQLFAGLRPVEAHRLTRDDIHESFIEIKGKKSKTRQRRLVTIHPTLAAWLKLSCQLPVKNLRRRFWRLRYDSTTVNAKGKKAWKSIVNWSHDCLRHAFCSYHLAQFKSAAKTAIEAGHSEQILFNHYRELVRPQDAEKFWNLTPEAILTVPITPSQTSAIRPAARSRPRKRSRLCAASAPG